MGTETDDQRGQPHAIAAPSFSLVSSASPHTNKQYLPTNNTIPPITHNRLALTGNSYHLQTFTFDWKIPLAWKAFSLLERCFPCLLVFFLFGKVFPCLEVFSLFGKVSPCLEVSHHANPKSPSKFPRKPKTFRYFVPRGTLIQSRISRSLFLIALYTCFIQ